MDIFGQILSIEKPTSPGNIRTSLIDLLSELGESLGYTVLVNQDVACEWIKESEHVAIEVQFGNQQEIYQSLRRLSLSPAQNCVLIISSNSRSMGISEVADLIRNTFSIKSKEFMVLDIETRQHVRLGGMQKKQKTSQAQQKSNTFASKSLQNQSALLPAQPLMLPKPASAQKPAIPLPPSQQSEKHAQKSQSSLQQNQQPFYQKERSQNNTNQAGQVQQPTYQKNKPQSRSPRRKMIYGRKGEHKKQD